MHLAAPAPLGYDVGRKLSVSTFTSPITLHSASEDRSEAVEVLVDTGSAFTAVDLVEERLTPSEALWT